MLTEEEKVGIRILQAVAMGICYGLELGIGLETGEGRYVRAADKMAMTPRECWDAADAEMRDFCIVRATRLLNHLGG
jgi:hypothetical protein